MSPALIWAFAAAIAFEILFPIALGVFIWRRYRVSWKYFGFGALVFFVVQLATRVPAVQLIQAQIAPALQESMSLFIIWGVILALTAAVFEEVGRYFGYRWLFKNGKTWRNAIMYGAGHGGIESIVLVGFLTASSLVSAITLASVPAEQLATSPEQLEQIRQAQELFRQMDWWQPLLGAAERLLAMSIQVSMAVIVLQVFLRRNLIWLFGALAYHFVIDLVAVFAVRFANLLIVEGILVVFAAFSLYLILRFKPADPMAGEGAADGPSS